LAGSVRQQCYVVFIRDNSAEVSGSIELNALSAQAQGTADSENGLRHNHHKMKRGAENASSASLKTYSVPRVENLFYLARTSL